jgi:hypothetical protein
MTRAAHTPGPWAVNPVAAHVDAFAGGEPLAVCAMLWPTELRSEAETEANARLIASSPDLLFLARKVAEHFENTDAPLGILARAVIEKVEGQS